MSNFIPFPLKLFSFIPKPIVVPSVPTPAPAEISPVGFSQQLNQFFWSFSSVSIIFSDLTDLKKFLKAFNIIY